MNSNKIKLEIITPNGVAVDKDVYMVSIRTKKGNIGLQKGKSPFMGNVIISQMDIYNERNEKPVGYAISDGIVLATPNLVNIVTDSCEQIDQIDIQQAIKNREFAIAKIKQHKSREKILEYEHKLKKEINKINLYNNK